MRVQDYHRKIKKANGQAKQMQKQAVRKIQPLIIQLNKNQLAEGIRTDGQKLLPKYKDTGYALKKRSMNPKPGFGTPDLFLTGKFYGGFKVDLGASAFKILSKGVDYAKYIEGRYIKIYGLTKNHLSEVTQTATREFVSLWKRAVK